MYVLSTLHRLRQMLGFASSDTADDLRLIEALKSASSAIERATGRRFTPRVAAIQHDLGILSNELMLMDDLLELTSIADATGSIPLADVLLMPDTDDITPVGWLQLTNGRTFSWGLSPARAVTLTGTWGWHDRYPQAWRSSGDSVQNNPLTSIATTLTVSDADGADSATETPRFQVGQLLKVGTEFMRVMSVNTVTNQLTVLRGMNGTTAASQPLNTPISVFQPPTEVEALALQLAVALYRQPDLDEAMTIPAGLVDQLTALRRLRV
jgi:hypothetical protein